MATARNKNSDRKQSARSLTLPKPYFEEGGITLYHGDSLQLLPRLLPMGADALITDPPYCSGGMSAAERTRDPREKYCQDGNDCGRPSFSGDAKDQRSFGFWATLWMTECRRHVKDGGYCLVFVDWRQLPMMTDVVQAGGFVWRGVISWNKGRGARAPHKGYFRHQCEYVAWGTNGRCEKATHGGPFDGCIEESVKQTDKFHMTGKPTPLMRKLVEAVRPKGLIVDPFAGSSTTLVAAAMTGRRAIGIEQSREYCEVSAERIREALAARSRKAA